MRNPPWNDQENAALCRMYFDMLHAAINGHSYNKAGIIRSYQFSTCDHVGHDSKHPEALAARSRGSIEAKLMNATACHRDLDPAAVTMNSYGYKAAPNYQGALKVAVLAESRSRRVMRQSEGVA